MRFGKRRARRSGRAIARAMVINLPNFLRLLVRLYRDARVPVLEKMLFLFVVVYVLVPADLIPDFLSFLGLVDDVYLIGLALNRMLMRAGPNLLLEHWDGDPRELGYLVEQVGFVGGLLPRPIRNVLRRSVRRAS